MCLPAYQTSVPKSCLNCALSQSVALLPSPSSSNQLVFAIPPPPPAGSLNLSPPPYLSSLPHPQLLLILTERSLAVRLEWRCRGCFSISETRETLIAELDLSGATSGGRKGKPAKPEIFIHPHRFQLVPSVIKNPVVEDDIKGGAGGASGGHLFNLQIRPTDTADSGRYFCLVNGERRPWRLYSVAVQDVPSTPGKPLIMAFNSTAVNLSWTPPLQHHHAAVTHYLIQASTFNKSSDN